MGGGMVWRASIRLICAVAVSLYATQARGSDGRILFRGAVVTPTTAWTAQVAAQRAQIQHLPLGTRLQRLDVPELGKGRDPLLDYYVQRVAPPHPQLVVVSYP